jgi:hypothetical protein
MSLAPKPLIITPRDVFDPLAHDSLENALMGSKGFIYRGKDSAGSVWISEASRAARYIFNHNGGAFNPSTRLPIVESGFYKLEHKEDDDKTATFSFLSSDLSYHDIYIIAKDDPLLTRIEKLELYIAAANCFFWGKKGFPLDKAQAEQLKIQYYALASTLEASSVSKEP